MEMDGGHVGSEVVQQRAALAVHWGNVVDLAFLFSGNAPQELAVREVLHALHGVQRACSNGGARSAWTTM
jgi:hypothetical protein